MKIKKVEIQGFRAYQNAQDATYNFMLNDGDCADFVSIYAPNGFGKTSFYDAVEWGMTNNISRLLKREKENAIVAKEERKKDVGPNGEKKKQFILRNRDFGETGNAYVKIETTFSEKEYSPKRNVPDVLKKGGTDFGFSEKETLKKMTFFRDVILSQDWIDAFLKEDTAENRYQRFMDYFGDKKIDTYYNNLVGLIKENEDKIKEIRKKIAERSKIPFEIADNKIIETTNAQIEYLVSLGENLNKIDIYFNELTKKKLEDIINNRLIEIDNSIEKLIYLLEEIASQSTKIDLYFDKKKQHHTILSDINLLKESKKRVRERESLTNQVNNLRKDVEKINNQKKYIDDILKIYPVYQQVKERISRAENDQRIYISALEAKNADAETIKNNINNLQREINKLYDSNLTIDTQIKDIPSIYEKIRSLNVEIKEKQEKNLLQEDKRQEYRQISNRHESSKKIIEQNLTYFEAGSFINIEGLSEEKQTNITQIEKIIRDIKSSNEQIKNYEKKIAEEIQIKEDVKSLIKIGTEIVEQSKSEFCPLCHSKHESFQNLLEKISANPLLSEKESALLKNKSSEEIKLKINNDLLDTLKNEIKNEILEKQQQLDVEILKNTKSIYTIKQEISSLEQEISDKKTELEAYIKITENLNEKEFQLKLGKQREINTVTIPVEEGKLTKEVERLASLNKEIQTLIDKNKISADIISLIKENSGYKKILEFNESYFFEDASQEIIQNLINEELNKLKVIETQIADHHSEINKLNELLLPVKISEIENNITNKETQLLEILESLSGFNEFINKNNASGKNIESKEQVTDFIDKLRLDTDNKINLQKKIREEYQKLEKSKEYILPYLKQIKIKEEVSCAEKDLKKHTALKKDFEKERQGLASHIQNQINSFFHKELIVDIYSKIDPHPDYKEIDFTCNFDDTSPKLTVFVKSLGEEGKYISPSLYFSTAQLNVLSLSIFLAKALNTKDDKGRVINCIFLDDPIQSMDSINILSTIDLLRSLVVNHKKQLILSTHEENFHLLLQKKIPESLFRSKYIELETFGKIKTNN
jgi:exonuclease SbcC